MENSLLEFYRELSAKSEEIGKLKAQLEMKDKAIEGLEAMLSLRGVTVTSVDTSLTSSFPSVEHSCKCGKEVVESAKVESAKTALSKLEETVSDIVTTKPHRGRKSNAEKKLATESTQESSSAESTQESSSAEKLGGGSVFKDFVPLETSSVMSPHSQAYLPPEKKASSNVLTVL